MNNWKIPGEMEAEIRARDKKCVYCGKNFGDNTPPTWEHIINDASIISLENIALCCGPCNSSKGQKELTEWLKSPYCLRNDINMDVVADVVLKAIEAKLKVDGM
jgi:hypothetical protein